MISTVPGQAATPRRLLPVVLAAILGLVLGAGGVGLGWWLTGRTAPQAAAPIAVGLDRMPTSFAGSRRDDLAAEEQKAGEGERMRAEWDRIAPALTQAYGGASAEARYGLVDGLGSTQLQLANAVLPAPVTVSDEYLARLGFLGPTQWIQLPEAGATTCVAAAGPTGQRVGTKLPATAADVAQAKRDLEGGTSGRISCVRSDAGRQFSVSVTTDVDDRDGTTVSDRAKQIAAAIDQLWTSLTG